MKVSDCQAFLAGVEAAGLKVFSFVTDIDTHIHNNERSIAYADIDNEVVWGLTNTAFGGSTGAYRNKSMMVIGADFGDIHEFRCGCNGAEMLKFCEGAGIPLTDEQKKMIINSDTDNFRIIPPTGDYTFKVLSEKEIEKLSPEEKEKYEADLADYNAPYGQKRLRPGQAARITTA